MEASSQILISHPFHALSDSELRRVIENASASLFASSCIGQDPVGRANEDAASKKNQLSASAILGARHHLRTRKAI